jgi:uncharacterized membrane protein YkvA (DUF1232 family)
MFKEDSVETPDSGEVDLPDIRRAQRSYTRMRGRITAWLQDHDVGEQTREYLLVLPDLFALLIRLMRDPRVDRPLRLQLLAVATYVISPIDLIPDFILPAGLIDDTVALAFILTRVVKLMGTCGEDVLREHWEGDGDVLVQVRRVTSSADKLLNDRIIGSLARLFR